MIKIKPWMVAALFLLSATGAVAGGGSALGWWRATTQSSVPMTATSTHPVHWDDTAGNIRFSDGTNNNYVTACVPTTTGDTCVWDNGAGKWTRNTIGLNSTVAGQIIVSPHDAGGTAPADTLYMIEAWIPADACATPGGCSPGVNTVTVTLANRLDIAATRYANITTDLAVGTPTVNFSDWATVPTKFAGITVTADGTVEGPITVVRNAAGYIGICYYVPFGAAFGSETTLLGWKASGANDVLHPAAVGETAGGAVALHVAIAYKTAAPKLVIEGDSTSRGLSGAAAAGITNSLWRLGPDYGINVCLESTGGRTWGGYITEGYGYYYDDCNLKGADAVLWMLGVNDSGSANELTYESYLRQSLTYSRAQGAQRIWVQTITEYSTANAGRTNYNAWLRTQSLRAWGLGEIDYVFDASDLLHGVDQDHLAAQYDSGDGTHISAAAYAAEEAKLVSDGKISAGAIH